MKQHLHQWECGPVSATPSQKSSRLGTKVKDPEVQAFDDKCLVQPRPRVRPSTSQVLRVAIFCYGLEEDI
ncbi:hypothetical protein CKAN_00007900 [Cinnamomum micranthum f. kanehirae]|uniref:Uncharacterized protein n=1 Tax=Cinnamomum micranthum f. kanehirae TaxID=337451 RepID=A0A443N041_9MAGN|nr:hypothetical protein CKAN_00007900 [Cinnamomum micranthum f. kanehirae]